MKYLLYSVLFLCSTTLFAQQPGTLDPLFGEEGKVLAPLPFNDSRTVLAVQPDGKTLRGVTDLYSGKLTFRIDRLLQDGSPDLDFGTNGTAFVEFYNLTDPFFDGATLYALFVQPDGKILAAGYAGSIYGSAGIARLNPDGSQDSSFGMNGTSIVGNQYLNFVFSIALQTDGKIMLGGESLTDFVNNTYRFMTIRCLPDGSLDPDFAKEGILMSRYIGAANTVAVQPDGKIVAAGYSGSLFSGSYFHIERYNENGTYDKDFGNGDGIVDTTVGSGSCAINSIALQADGKIVVAGGVNGYFPTQFGVARFNSDGNLDKSFGNGGWVSEFGGAGSEATKVMLTRKENEDRVVVAGSVTNSATKGDFALAAYYSNGTKDTDFGKEGTQVTDIGSNEYLTGAGLQTDGKIVVAGFMYANGILTNNYIVARYYGYPQKVSLIVRIKRWLHNHTITWKGLPADDKISYYSVEQSNNNRDGFTPVAKVNGVSNLKDYSFTNSSLLEGKNYYRIKAVSGDGVVRYSEVVSADNSANTASVYPNPARDYVTVQGLKANETANISITDGNGNVRVKGVSTGSAQYRSQLTNLQPGTYYVNITANGKTETVKFVKSN